MKVTKRVIGELIKIRNNLNEMQFGFVLERNSSDVPFIVWQLQKKYLVKNEPLYLAFVNLEKAQDRMLFSLISVSTEARIRCLACERYTNPLQGY